MDRKKKMAFILGFVILAAVIIFVAAFVLIQREQYTFKTTDAILRNPMTGFAPNADYIDAVGDNTLVYVDVTWRELEPEEGLFDFETIKEENYLDRWRAEGKKVVFRFICDLPSDEEHMDIPDWLYEKTGDGTFYDSDYGKGYSPNYSNRTFIAYHEAAIKALGEAYGKDTFFCYIELGSIGHWGEWHVKYDEGLDRIPTEEVCRQYVLPYIEAFPNAKMLMRRPFSFVTEYELGVYNDMTGEPEDTMEWLDWIANGGVYTEPVAQMELPAYPNVWDKNPVGGEFTSSISMEEMLVSELDRTLSLLEDSHMTFIGPKCPIANQEEMDYPEEVGQILSKVGYRYGVTKASVSYNRILKTATLTLEIKNNGVAPVYFNWPLCVYVLDDNNQVIDSYELQLNLMELTGGKSDSEKIALGPEQFTEGIPKLAVGIENPETGEPEVFLDMDTEMAGNRYLLNP